MVSVQCQFLSQQWKVNFFTELFHSGRLQCKKEGKKLQWKIPGTIQQFYNIIMTLFLQFATFFTVFHYLNFHLFF